MELDYGMTTVANIGETQVASLSPNAKDRLARLIEARAEISAALEERKVGRRTKNRNPKKSEDIFSSWGRAKLEAMELRDRKPWARIYHAVKVENESIYKFYHGIVEMEVTFKEKVKQHKDLVDQTLVDLSPETTEWMRKLLKEFLRVWPKLNFKEKHHLFAFKERPTDYHSLPEWHRIFIDSPERRDGFINKPELIDLDYYRLQILDWEIDRLLGRPLPEGV